MNMKYKTVHSIGDFINLPHRLSDSPMMFWANDPSSPASSVIKNTFSSIINQLYSFVSTDYLANMDKVHFTADQTTKFGGPPRYAMFTAWNPYLDASLLGPNYNTYTKMYNYFKYKGIKVKWIPNVKTSNFIQPKITGILPTIENMNYDNRVVYPQVNSSSLASSVSEYRDGSQYAKYANGGLEDSGITTVSQTGTFATAGYQNLPTYQNLVPSYDENTGYAPSLKMHVLFSKDEYGDINIPADPLFTPSTQQPSPQFIKDSVYKFKPYTMNMKTQNYKIYDMSKPFKFYCRPYCASDASETLNGITSNTTADQSILAASQTAIYDGNKIIKKKRLVPRMSVIQDRMLDIVSPLNTTIQQKWQARISDSNFFNPVLFGYFFTADGIEVDNWIKSIYNLVGEADFDKCVPKYNRFISSYGHFEITVYASFNELNNTLIE